MNRKQKIDLLSGIVRGKRKITEVCSVKVELFQYCIDDSPEHRAEMERQVQKNEAIPGVISVILVEVETPLPN
jgi:hypothetical protein